MSREDTLELFRGGLCVCCMNADERRDVMNALMRAGIMPVFRMGILGDELDEKMEYNYVGYDTISSRSGFTLYSTVGTRGWVYAWAFLPDLEEDEPEEEPDPPEQFQAAVLSLLGVAG